MQAGRDEAVLLECVRRHLRLQPRAGNRSAVGWPVTFWRDGVDELLVKWRRGAAALQFELGRTPTPEEVAQRLLPATYDAVQQPRAMQRIAGQLVATMDPKALAYQIIGPAGDIAMRSENAPETPFPVPRQAGFHDTPRYRVYAQPAAAAGLVMMRTVPPIADEPNSVPCGPRKTSMRSKSSTRGSRERGTGVSSI